MPRSIDFFFSFSEQSPERQHVNKIESNIQFSFGTGSRASIRLRERGKQQKGGLRLRRQTFFFSEQSKRRLERSEQESGSKAALALVVFSLDRTLILDCYERYRPCVAEGTFCSLLSWRQELFLQFVYCHTFHFPPTVLKPCQECLAILEVANT
jgi:hypothetical protein